MLFSISAYAGLSCLRYYKNNVPTIDEKFSSTIIDLNPMELVTFESFGAENFTCTGLTFDTIDEVFWIADFGALNKYDEAVPRIIAVDKNLNKCMNNMLIGGADDPNLQGLAFDESNNTLWVCNT